MPDWFVPLLAHLKSSRTFAAAVALGCGFLLFTPIDELQRFPAELRLLLWVGFAVGTSFLLVTLVVSSGRWLIDRFAEHHGTTQIREHFKKMLEGLTPDELAILRLFASEKRRTLELPASNVAVELLVRREIIRPIGGVVNMHDRRVFFKIVDDDLWDYLQEQTETGGGAPP